MDIGLSHLITVNGEHVRAYWDTFNPNLSLGVNHEILVFADDIDLDSVFTALPTCLIKQSYEGKFSLVEKNDTVERYLAKYNISLLTKSTDTAVKTFLFTSSGVPWAICRLETAVAIKKDIKTTFFFESAILINNKNNITNELWDVNIDKFNIKYAARVSDIVLTDPTTFIVMSMDPTLNETSSDEQVRKSIIEKGVKMDIPYIFEDGKIGIKVVAKTDNDVVGVKAIFIRILWNMGILIYMDSVKWATYQLPNLTLAKGHQLKLVFGITFKELKNDTTI